MGNGRPLKLKKYHHENTKSTKLISLCSSCLRGELTNVLKLIRMERAPSPPRHIHIAQYNRLLVNIKFVFFRLNQHRVDNGLFQHRHVARISPDNLF